MSKTNLRIDLDKDSTFEFLTRTEADDSGVIAVIIAEGEMGKLGLGLRSLKQIKRFRDALGVAESLINKAIEEKGMAEEDEAMEILIPLEPEPELYARLDHHGSVALSEDTRTLPRRHADAAHLLHERRLKDRRGAHAEEGETE